MVDSKEYLKSLKKRYPLQKIQELLDSLKGKRVLIIGDTIIDEYLFVDPKGRAMKDPILSVDYSHQESYAGGILAIANHVVNFAEQVTLVTLLGSRDNFESFVKENIDEKIELSHFIKENSPTNRKTRYISNTRKEKMFKVEHINDNKIDTKLELDIIDFLKKELSKYDLVVVGDFGHGFINDNIIRILEQEAKYLAVNAQTNSANLGFNYVTRYDKPSFITMDGNELSHAVGSRFENPHKLIQKLHEKKGFNNFLVTLGKDGVSYFKNGNLIDAPSLASKIVDVVGSGDAVFSITSLLAHAECDQDLLTFIANCAGGVAVSIMGNKHSVTKEDLLEFIKEKYNSVEEGDIKDYLNNVNSTLGNLDHSNISEFVKLLLDVYHNNNTIYVFGNGGSAATASHFCGDLVKGVSYGLEKRFKVVCLNDNIPSLMAIANDISYDDIFVEQLKNFLGPGDIVVGISGSGNSVNVIKAFEYAKSLGVRTAAICGYTGGKLKEMSDLVIHAKVEDMEVSEDIHNLIITHCVKRVLTNELDINNVVGDLYARRVSPSD